MINGDANVTITINLNTNVVANLIEKIPTLKEGNSIKEEELTEMLDTLKTTKKYRLQKEDLIVYVKDVNTSYEIYFQYTEETDMFKSLANVVKILNPEIYKYMVDENGVTNIEPGSPYYNIITNVNFTEPDIFTNTTGIFETIISK